MADKTLNAVVKLRRDSETNFNAIAETFTPKRGEVCLVDTDNYGLRCKVGDGFRKFGQLNYEDNKDSIILVGRFFNDKFYTDSTYQTELVKGEQHIYVNSKTNELYLWYNNGFHTVTPEATDTVAGIMKLYDYSGDRTDGTMTQKAITDGVNAIKFELDEEDDECLILDLPWD